MKRVFSIIMVCLLSLSMFSIFAPKAKAETSMWTAKTPLPRPQALSGMAVANGKVYVIGGQYQGGDSDANYEYDPISDSWTSKASMPTKRTSLNTVSVNDKIYAVGGSFSTGGGAFSTNEEFDPATNSWTTKASMPTPRNWISAAAVNDQIYVMGGSDNFGGIFSMNEMYDTSTDTWTTKKPDPQARLACGIGVVNGKIYLIGGWVRPGAPPGEPTTLNEEYDPQTDTWTTKAPMPRARNGLAVAVVNNRIYAIGGATDFNPWTNNLNVVEEYDPSTDTWTTVQSMPTPRSLLDAGAVGDEIFVVGGWGSAGCLDTNEELSIGASVGYWKFDEGSGTIAYDSSGNGNDGSLINNPQWAAGVSGSALSFDGQSSYVNIPDSPSLRPSGVEVSVEFWFKPTVTLDSSTPATEFIDKGNSYGFVINMPPQQPVPNGKIGFIVSIDSPYYNGHWVETRTSQWLAGSWYHIAGTYDGSFLKIYVNGVLENSMALTGTYLTSDPYSLAIAAYDMAVEWRPWFFNGRIDEVSVYAYPLTSAEVHNNYSLKRPVHELTVASSPITGIPFTMNDELKATQYIDTLPDGSYILEMPQTYNGYVWSHWLEDGDTNRIKTIVLHTDPTLTGVYVLAGPPTPPVGGEWVPIATQTLTPSNILQMLAPWIALASLAMLALTSFVYVKHKKKQQN